MSQTQPRPSDASSLKETQAAWMTESQYNEVAQEQFHNNSSLHAPSNGSSSDPTGSVNSTQPPSLPVKDTSLQPHSAPQPPPQQQQLHLLDHSLPTDSSSRSQSFMLQALQDLPDRIRSNAEESQESPMPPLPLDRAETTFADLDLRPQSTAPQPAKQNAQTLHLSSPDDVTSRDADQDDGGVRSMEPTKLDSGQERFSPQHRQNQTRSAANSSQADVQSLSEGDQATQICESQSLPPMPESTRNTRPQFGPSHPISSPHKATIYPPTHDSLDGTSPEAPQIEETHADRKARAERHTRIIDSSKPDETVQLEERPSSSVQAHDVSQDLCKAPRRHEDQAHVDDNSSVVPDSDPGLLSQGVASDTVPWSQPKRFQTSTPRPEAAAHARPDPLPPTLPPADALTSSPLTDQSSLPDDGVVNPPQMSMDVDEPNNEEQGHLSKDCDGINAPKKPDYGSAQVTSSSSRYSAYDTAKESAPNQGKARTSNNSADEATDVSDPKHQVSAKRKADGGSGRSIVASKKTRRAPPTKSREATGPTLHLRQPQTRKAARESAVTLGQNPGSIDAPVSVDVPQHALNKKQAEDEDDHAVPTQPASEDERDLCGQLRHPKMPHLPVHRVFAYHNVARAYFPAEIVSVAKDRARCLFDDGEETWPFYKDLRACQLKDGDCIFYAGIDNSQGDEVYPTLHRVYRVEWADQSGRVVPEGIDLGPTMIVAAREVSSEQTKNRFQVQAIKVPATKSNAVLHDRKLSPSVLAALKAAGTAADPEGVMFGARPPSKDRSGPAAASRRSASVSLSGASPNHKRTAQSRGRSKRAVAASRRLDGYGFWLTGFTKEEDRSTSKASPQRKPVLGSKSPRTENELRDLIEEHGGIVLNEVSDLLDVQIDHKSGAPTLHFSPLATSLNHICLLAKEPSRKSFKYLIALALGVPCLSSGWLDQSLQQSSVLPISSSLMGSGMSVTLNGSVLGLQHNLVGVSDLSLTSIQERCHLFQLFKNKRFLRISAAELKKPNVDATTSLLAVLGAASILHTSEKDRDVSKKLQSVDYVLVDDQIKKTPSTGSVHCVNVDWLKECLISGRVWE